MGMRFDPDDMEFYCEQSSKKRDRVELIALIIRELLICAYLAALVSLFFIQWNYFGLLFLVLGGLLAIIYVISERRAFRNVRES